MKIIDDERMSYVSYEKFVRSEFYYNVSGIKKFLHKSFDEVNRSLHEFMTVLKLNLTKVTEQSELLQSGIIFIEKNDNDFEKQINLNEIKELREVDFSLHESVYSSLKAFDIS